MTVNWTEAAERHAHGFFCRHGNQDFQASTRTFL